MNGWGSLGITSDATLRQLAAQMRLPKIKYIGFIEDLNAIPDGVSIINLGDNQLSGTHWVLLWSDPKQIIYSDSYGVGPEDRVIELAGDKPIYYNTRQVQGFKDSFCGIWVLLTAKAIVDAKKNGIDAHKALDTFMNSFEAV